MAKFDIILKGTGEEDTKRPSRMQQSLNSELILSKEQLYDMFQQILSVKKFEHQILFNALMVRAGILFLLNSLGIAAIVVHTSLIGSQPSQDST